MMETHFEWRALRRAAAVLALLFAAGTLAPAALAQHEHGRGQGQGHGYGHGYGHGGGPGHRGGGHQWRGDIARFHGHDRGAWRGGHWAHAHHGGRLGWWWVVGPSWYYYPAPVYPYPGPWVPGAVIVAAPAPVAPMPLGPYWYYCEALRTYYPYVSYCPSGWREVPAAPVAGVPAPVPRRP